MTLSHHFPSLKHAGYVSFSFYNGVIHNNRVREMGFGLFLPSVLSVFTSSHFQEEELAEK